MSPLLSFSFKLVLQNLAFSNEKIVSSESEEQYAQTKHSLETKPFVNSCKQIWWWILMWQDNDILLVEVLWWIMDWYFGQKQQFKVKKSWWICFLYTDFQVTRR